MVALLCGQGKLKELLSLTSREAASRIPAPALIMRGTILQSASTEPVAVWPMLSWFGVVLGMGRDQGPYSQF